MSSERTAPVHKPLAEYYGDEYYAHSCGGAAPYRRDEPSWVAFFGRVADRLVAELDPRTVLDAGCAIGLLVEALHDRGVEAWGLDFSAYAIEQVREDLRPFCWVGSVTEDFDRTYELITCIEVLEHLPAEDADRAVANLTSHTDRVLFSSTPDDFQEPTHLNVQPSDYWAGLFAAHGFYRDLDFDASFVSQHAVLFRRQRGLPIGVIRAYERRCAQLGTENRALRAAQLAAANDHAQAASTIQAPQASSETESRVLAVLVGAGRLAAPLGTLRRRVLGAVVKRFVDTLDRAYVRVRSPAQLNSAVQTAPSANGQRSGSGQSEPFGAINSPTSGASVRVVTLISGWALDRASPRGAGITAVRVWVDGVWKGTATYGIDRDDVAGQFGQQFKRCGWEFALDVQHVAPGPHTVQVTAHSSVSGEETIYSLPLTVAAPLPALAATGTRFALFISGSPGDPKRYRCDHQAQQLQLLGVMADVAVYGEVALGDVVDRYHVFVLHRVQLSQDVAWLVDEARRRGRLVVYDTDDLVFDLDATKLLETGARGPQALASCDAVLVSTQPLHDLASRIHPRVLISPNVVDRSMVDQARAVQRRRTAERRRSDLVTIGYLCGTPTHDRDFLEIADALLWALDTYPATRLVTVGPLTLDARFERFGDRVEQLPLRPAGQLAELIGELDISLAPLEPDTPFNQAKSCVKYLEAALVGVPTIASPLPDFRRVITDGVTGFLARDLDGWRAALAQLIESPELRERIGQAARQEVLDHHTTAASATALLDAFRELMPGASDDEPLAIDWVVRAPLDHLSAVVPAPVARLAGYLGCRGHHVRLAVQHRTGGRAYEPHEFAAEVQRYGGTVGVETIVGRVGASVADVQIATDATTAHLVAAHGSAPFRAYFIHDAPTSRSDQAALFLPLRAIGVGPSVADRVFEITGGPVARIDVPADDVDEAGWAAAGAQLERCLLDMAFVSRLRSD